MKSFLLRSWHVFILVFLMLFCGRVDATENNIINQIVPQRVKPYWELVHISAVDWADLFLDDQYSPPKGIKYVFLPASNEGEVDLLQARYEIGSNTFTISQSLSIFSLTVAGAATNIADKTNIVQIAQDIARRVFSGGQLITLKQDNQSESRTEGAIAPEGIQTNTVWLNGLKWWSEEEDIVFYFIKKSGRPSSLDKGYTLDSNAKWFTRSGSRTKSSRD